MIFDLDVLRVYGLRVMTDHSSHVGLKVRSRLKFIKLRLEVEMHTMYCPAVRAEYPATELG